MPPPLTLYLVQRLGAAQYPSVLSISTIVANQNIGTVAFAGILFSFYTASSIVGGAIFSKINAIFKRYTALFIVLLFLSAHILICHTASAVTYGIAYVLLGFGFTFFSPLLYLYCGTITDPDNTAKMSSYIMATGNLSVFFSNFWISFVGNLFGNGELIMTPIKCAVFILAAICVAMVFVDPRPTELR